MRVISNDYSSNVPGSDTPGKGGPARFTADFSAFLLAQGHEWIGLLHDASLSVGLTAELYAAPGAHYVAVSAPAATIEGLRGLKEEVSAEVFFKKDIEAVEALIAAHKPDLLFLNGFSAYAWILYAAARKSGLPVVIQHAGIFTKEVEMYNDLFSAQGRALCAWMERDAAEGAEANIFLNETSREYFIECVQPQPLSNPVIIPLPHAGWPFVLARTPRVHTEKVLGVVARWDRIKNQEAVLALAEEVHRRGLPWRIRAVTSMPDTPVHAEMKARYRELIEVLPHMDREALQAFYATLDTLLLPSHFDVSPTVVMEGAAAGVPTLISPGVGWTDTYRACGMEEWIVNFSDPAQVVARLEVLLARGTHPELDRFSKHIEECNNPQKVYTAYISLFASIAAGR